MEKKRKMTKRQETTINSFYIYFLGKFIFCRKRIWNNLVYTVTFALQFFELQVIGNAAIKHQRPYRYVGVLQTWYFDPKYLAIY